MPSSGMLRRVALVRTEVPPKCRFIHNNHNIDNFLRNRWKKITERLVCYTILVPVSIANFNKDIL
jgi:hypothetical protein